MEHFLKIQINNINSVASGLYEGVVLKNTDKVFVFKITHAQIFQRVLSLSDNEVDITHKCTAECIESILKKHFENLEEFKHKKVIIAKQAKGPLTDILMIFCRQDGYHMQTLLPYPTPAFCLGRRDDQKVRKTVLYYLKSGARVIFEDNTRPDRQGI